jgi:diguanylate cyclase (GGDEF)-like protein/PAS domain S-box-containing protein
MHPLLRRLFEEHLPQGTALPPGWGAFLEAVDRAWSGTVPTEGEPAAGEATFRALAETISAAVFVYRGTRYRYVNAAATTLTGYSADELLGMDFWELVHPDDREVVRERGMARQRGDRVPSRYELRIVTRGGEERWVDFTSATVRYGGEPAALGTAFDVTDRRRAADELRRQLLTLENLSDAVVHTDAEGRVTGLNPAAERLYGYTEAEALGRTPDLWLRGDDSGVTVPDVLAELERRGRWSGETRFARSDGSRGIAESTVVAVLDERGRRVATLGVNRDVTERRRAEAALRESEERYRALFEESRDAIYMTAADGRFEAVNQAALDLFGYAREEMLGMELRDLCADPGSCEVLDAEMEHAGFVRDHEVRLRRSDGGTLHCLLAASRRSGRGGAAVQGIVHDISERKRAEEQLAYGAFHDPLTGLPNRALFLDRLAQAVDRVRRRDGSALAVLFLDLDRFKVINDSLGHGTGDELLRALGGRLAEALRPGDTAARFGGDEFTVLLDNVGDAVTATHVAQRILDSLASPFHLSRSEVYTTASAGIALHSGGAASPEELVRSAGTALGRAKARGRARCELFDRAMHAEAMDRLQMEMDLRPAAERGELRLVYQPVVSLLEGGGVAGFEALLRWDHPALGTVLPEQFIPVAEETGLIVPIGEWVLGEACRQLRRWRDRFPARRITVGVNLSPRQFARPELVERVAGILEATGVEPSALRLEITESLLIEHTAPTTAMLARLKAAGVGLCMDDFGTGYSSLSYLHRFPLDTLKIDRSFVMRVGGGGDAEPIVRTIAALAHNLGLAVVAEGVETAEQLEELRGLRCEYAQGYLFSRPLDAADADRLLEDDPRW